jgi:hypothetical protein
MTPTLSQRQPAGRDGFAAFDEVMDRSGVAARANRALERCGVAR